jgi:hypothetical protein
MNLRFTTVETALNRVEFRWKWLRFLQHTLTLVAALSLLVLGFAGAMAAGWVASRMLTITVFVLLGTLGFLAWIILTIAVAAGSPARGWLAAALERVDRRLLDRLNTLLFLEKQPSDVAVESFARRIARQTQWVFLEKPSPSPFSKRRTLVHLLAALLLVTATVLVFQYLSPWERMLAAERARAIPPVRPEAPLDLALPATNNVEQSVAWGEVKITDPGADLKVTKVDVVPLQIEAAANQSLQKVSWYSTINGAEETPHELPPPSEPRYAVYQPTVYLDELRLADWDLMTYYAKASTEKADTYASEVYFLEVRPFREDILKMPGGEGGQAYQCLNEMTALINRQQHVIRQTHQHVQRPPEQEKLREQDRQKLSDAETDLGDSAQHLYARMAAEMENKPIGEALDNLAKAEKSLGDAGQQLHKNAMNDAQAAERRALTELVAARKMFQKAVTDNPKDFEEPKDDGDAPPPVADAGKKLNEMAEFRNEAKAAKDFVQKTLDQQRKLDQRAQTAPRSDYSKMAEEERRMEDALRDFQQQHPRVFKGAEAQSEAAQQAMDKSADALQKRNMDAKTAAHEATRQMEQLDTAMASQSAERELADAYRLKQLLDKQIQTLDDKSRPDSKVSDQQLAQTAAEAKETVNQLKKTAEQEPTRDAFGQPLRDALSGTNKMDLDARLARVQQSAQEAVQQQQETSQTAGLSKLSKPMEEQQAADAAARRGLAASARDGLSNVSKAFAASEPQSTQMARKGDSLKPDGQESMSLGMSELESLLKQMEKQGKPSPEQLGKQGQEALYNLQSGLRSFYGSNERGEEVLLHLQQMLKGETPMETEDLKKLLEELQRFSIEHSEHLARKEDKPEVTNIDPERLPPAYRGRIQKYFQKLSEK